MLDGTPARDRRRFRLRDRSEFFGPGAPTLRAWGSSRARNVAALACLRYAGTRPQPAAGRLDPDVSPATKHSASYQKPMDYSLHVVAPGPRPPFFHVAELLWGAGCNIDSDGDSDTPDDRHWTELTIVLRSDPGQRVDIDPISNDPLILAVRSSHQSLCEQAAEFIAAVSGGDIRRA